MGLSRLENFLKNARGNILYVSPNDLDSTDSIENKGNSLTRPFKTIQRALIEAARFSYQRGLNNDRFGNTTILLYPGDHVVDNRPGWIPIPDGANAKFRLRDGTESSDFPAWDLTTIYDLNSADNALYKMNSIHGGVIVPRGTSIVGLDLRKTKIRPKYVPNPSNDNIERSALFRVTGACYFWQFSMFDADPNGLCYQDYTTNKFVPNFSHNKLTCFEYADGVNNIDIKDSFQTFGTNRTDLDVYYEKIGLVYGSASGREIEPDYPSTALDIEPKIDEFRIVGSTGASAGITSIKSGDGSISSSLITVTTSEKVSGLDVDTPFRVEGITATGYNGQFVVSEKLSDTQFRYEVQNAPIDALPTVLGSTVTLQSDTVTSASPYIFNLSLRSVFGMCGMHADGNRATGFKSMVVAQFTGISLQKDDNAFIKYNPTTGVYDDATVPGNEKLSTDSSSIYKPSYVNFHIKCSNNSVIQSVSIFAIGYAEHFTVETGGDMSITNSNSNFGAKSLNATGFRQDAFSQDDFGFITHILPPKEIPISENVIEFNSVDINTTIGVGTTGHLYLYQQTNPDIPPENVLEGFRVGARDLDSLKVLVPSGGTPTEFSSRIVMPNGAGFNTTTQYSSEKVFKVDRNASGINSITSSVITLTEPHTFQDAESVRVLSDNGRLPDGLDPNIVYFAITNQNASSGLTTHNTIKLAKTETDAKNASALTINNLGGSLKILSRVSDKNSGDIGHPIQFDNSPDQNRKQWYINVSTASTDNGIYRDVVLDENGLGLGSTALGEATPRSFIKRKSDTRSSIDTLYRVRYVIPSSNGGVIARPPVDGFIVQESNTSIGSTNSEVATYFGSGTLNHVNENRNFRFIAHANWDSNIGNILSELPHDLSVGSLVKLVDIKSGVNTTGIGNSGFNGTFPVTGITSAREFTVGISTDPGAFTNDTLTRNTSLPRFERKKYNTTYYVQNVQEIQSYRRSEQDGIYYLTILNSSVSPTVDPFTSDKFTQPVVRLYPQTDRDTTNSDPQPSISFADSADIGKVDVDDVKKSITRETIDRLINDIDVGIGLTDVITAVGGTSHRFNTNIDHGLNRVTAVSIASSGGGYGVGVNANYYNAKLISIGSSTTGKHATAKVSVDATGGITDVQIMDGGAAYGIGNTMHVVGVATTAGHSKAVVTVTDVYDNVGDIIRISGVTSEAYRPYNTLYRITEVEVGGAKSFTAISDPAITGVTTTGIGTIPLSNATSYLTGEGIRISNLTYDPTSGISTVTTVNDHGLKINGKIKISTGIHTLSSFDGDFIVKQNIDLKNFTILTGIAVTTEVVAIGSSMFAMRGGIQSNDGDATIENESLNGRMIPTYAGITTTLSSSVADAITTEVRLTNVGDLGLRIGDFLSIDDEIVRIKTAPTNPATNPLIVFRSVLGTRATAHITGAVVRRIKPYPIELRRHSINRASGHTWEYVGYGPGNYSTALPDRQNRLVTDIQELLAQSTKKEGGVNYFTGMNDRGISYAGNKKLSTVTGREEIFDTPIRSISGEDITTESGVNLINATEGTFSSSIRINGGNEGKVLSEFNGPVVFTNKVTSTAARGIEANNLFLQGDSTVSRKYTVGIATPINAGTPGDIVYFENPSQGDYLGWVYTSENAWKRFGNVSLSDIADIHIFDQVGIATTTPGANAFQVGAGDTVFAVSSDSSGVGVGIGTTANTKALRIHGDTEQVGNVSITGILTAGFLLGDGNGIFNLNASATGWSPVNEAYAGVGNTGVWATVPPNLDSRVGIGTSVPHFNLSLGSAGSGRTDLHVQNKSVFLGQITTDDVLVGGSITATSYRLDGASSNIRVGVVTSTTLVVGTALSTNGSNVGLGTESPRAKLDVDGSVRFRTSSENIETLSISAGNVDIDLSKGQTFNLVVSESVQQFTILNPPNDSTAFTIKISQVASGRSVGINTFKDNGGTSIDVYWPGGVVPIVTQIDEKIDIYSFKTFDGASTLFGIVGGQNFTTS
jgi:hypothetical protein